MSKKRKITLGVLAVILVLFLAYTRPRSLTELVGDSEFDNFGLTTVTPKIENGYPYFEIWDITNSDKIEEVAALREILEGSRYRASLVNLIPPFLDNGKILGNGDTIIHFGAVMKDGEYFSAICKGSGVTFYSDQRWKMWATDRDIAEKLMALVQKYGVKDD